MPGANNGISDRKLVIVEQEATTNAGIVAVDEERIRLEVKNTKQQEKEIQAALKHSEAMMQASLALARRFDSNKEK